MSPSSVAARGLVLSLALLMPSISDSACPNSCNGHGRCVDVARCECFGTWAGGDCSQRRCPVGRAWADAASAPDAAHAPGAECSARGRCNPRTGRCACEPGFDGEACERMQCPLGCDAHGTCDSMRRHAAAAGAGGAGQAQKAAFSYARAWDADAVWGCTCDAGYGAWDCAERPCPLGDDPLSTGQADEVQLLRCDLDPASLPGSQFTFAFRGAVSTPFGAGASAYDLKMLLQAMPTVGVVDVSFTGGGPPSASWCDARFQNAAGMNPIAQPASGVLVSVTFLTQHGALPRLAVLDQAARPLYGAKDNAVFTAADGETLAYTVSVGPGPVATRVAASVQGQKESVECSGRGLCDRRSGACRCFNGFTASDSRGGRGTVPDCGFAYLPITSCPASGGVECSGHGTCSGHPSYQCACWDGWAGGDAGDCSLRSCPVGAAWFDAPSADEVAHAPAECSNKGVCLRGTGRCACQELFEGEACERMTCPGSTSALGACSGHGQCLSMAALALGARSPLGDPEPQSYGADPNVAATWDAQKVRGCACDAGWTGHDCGERACARNVDIAEIEAHPDRVDAVQLLTCQVVDAAQAAGLGGSAGAAVLSLTFRGEATAPLPYTASAAAVKAALELLPSVGVVDVHFSGNEGGLPDQLCLPGTAQIAYFYFRQAHGELPPLRVAMDEASRDPRTLEYSAALGFADNQLVFCGGGAAQGFGLGGEARPADGILPQALVCFQPRPNYPPAGIRALTVQRGMSTVEECSGRGICDHDAGECQCFLGYGASDGMRGKGYIEDCGWREEIVARRGGLRAGWSS